MAFFIYYVRNDGTATANAGRYADSAKKAGSWATAFAGPSEYYGTLADALAASGGDSPTAGDVIVISDQHSQTINANTLDQLPAGVELATVDDSNVDTPRPAVTPQFTSSGNYYFVDPTVSSNFSCTASGLNIEVGAGVVAITNEAFINYLDLTYNANGTNYRVAQSSRKSFYINANLQELNIHDMRSDDSTFIGGVVTSGSGSPQFVQMKAASISCRLLYDGVDLSNVNSTLALTVASPKPHYLAFVKCKLPANWTISRVLRSPYQSILVVSCDSPYQLYASYNQGEVDFVTDIYYTAHETLSDGSTKGSLEFTPNENASRNDPLMFWINEIPETRVLAATNTEAATKTKVRVRFATATGDTLTDSDLVFLVSAPDSTAPYRHNWVRHWRSALETGLALSTETGSWTGTGLGTQYYFDIDMGVPGNGVVEVIPGVTKPDVTVYFSWQLEFVA